MAKIIEFKNKKDKFEEWFQEIKQVNFDNKQIESAFFMWEVPPTKDGFQAVHCKFNCDLDQLKWFHRVLGEHIKEIEFDKFMKEHINEYIEYI